MSKRDLRVTKALRVGTCKMATAKRFKADASSAVTSLGRIHTLRQSESSLRRTAYLFTVANLPYQLS